MDCAWGGSTQEDEWESLILFLGHPTSSSLQNAAGRRTSLLGHAAYTSQGQQLYMLLSVHVYRQTSAALPNFTNTVPGYQAADAFRPRIYCLLFCYEQGHAAGRLLAGSSSNAHKMALSNNL